MLRERWRLIPDAARHRIRTRAPQPIALVVPFRLALPLLRNMSRHNSFRRSHHYSFADERRVVYAHDLSGNFTFLNAQGERLLGYSCEEACRMNISEIVAPEFAPQVREQILSDASSMIGAVYEIEIVAKDGHRVPVEVSMRLVHPPGRGAEIEGLAIPSVTSEDLPSSTPQCLDTEFFYGIWLMD